MRKFLRDILTADARSSVYDLVRVGTLVALVVGFSLQVYVVVKGAPFDMDKFGIGTGLILAGGGGAMAMRRDREETKE